MHFTLRLKSDIPSVYGILFIMPIINCLTCGIDFNVIPSRIKTAKYCSKECKPSQKYEITIGERFNRLVILKEVEPEIQYGKKKWGQKIRRVQCLCDCGNITETRLIMVRNGDAKSCGCLTREQAKINTDQTTHGKSKTKLYDTWNMMLARCYNENSSRFHRYGGRGIIVCEKWRKFEGFYEDVIVGYEKHLTLDRYPNNDGNYEPNNFRWATKKQQAGNTSQNIVVEVDGEKMCLTAACEKLSLPYNQVRNRIKKKGMSFEDAIKQPFKFKKKK